MTDPSCTALRDDHPLDRAVPADLPEIARALAEAFAGYPWTDWIVPGDDRGGRLRALHELAAGRVGLPHGETWVVRCPRRAVAGAVIALPPDRDVPARVWADVARIEEPLLGERLRAARDAEERTAHLRPDEPVLTVATIGVVPDHRRCGLATRLLEPVLGLADELGAPAYLETSSPANVTFYGRLGFTVIGRTDIPGGGPSVWAMRRPPQPPPGQPH